jgi:hypothetical protein
MIQKFRPYILKVALYMICNKDIIPQRLLDSLHNIPSSRVKVIVDPDLYPECVSGRKVLGPYAWIRTLVLERNHYK